MFEFVFVSHLSLLLVGLFRRFLENRNIISFFVIGSLTFFVHPTAVVLLPVPFIVAATTHWRELGVRRLAVFLAWCLVVVVVNAVWVVPLLSYIGIKTSSATYFQVYGMGEFARLLLRPGNAIALGLIVLAAVGTWSLLKTRRVADALVPLSATMFLILVAAYGAFVPGIRQMEPGRFLVPAMFFLAPLVGAGLRALLVRFSSAYGHRPRVARVATWLVVVLLVSPFLLSFLSARTKYRHRLKTTPSAEVTQLIEAVRLHTNRSGRLMIEDGPAALCGGSHLPGLLALYTDVEQIGGPYPHTFLEHHFATFQADWTFGKTLAERPPDALWPYINAYNVAWILTATTAGRDYIVQLGTDVKEVWRSRRYTLWRVERTPQFADIAGVVVDAGYNRIDVVTPRRCGRTSTPITSRGF